MSFSRRQFLMAMAAGGAVIAGELWIPGQRKIFIPSDLKIRVTRDAVFDRQYGFDPKFAHSWAHYVWNMPDGSRWSDHVRMKGVDVTTDAVAAAEIERKIFANYHNRVVGVTKLQEG